MAVNTLVPWVAKIQAKAMGNKDLGPWLVVTIVDIE
jgi:hypothetical protein